MEWNLSMEAVGRKVNKIKENNVAYAITIEWELRIAFAQKKEAEAACDFKLNFKNWMHP